VKNTKISKKSTSLIAVSFILITSFFLSIVRADINMGQGLFDSDAVLDNAGFKYGTQDWVKQLGSWSVSSNERPDGDPADTQSLYLSNIMGLTVQFYQEVNSIELSQILGKDIDFSIWVKSSNDLARVSIKYQDPSYTWHICDGSYVSPSIEPGDLAWTHVSVTQLIPEDAVRVRFVVFVIPYDISDVVESYVDEAKVVISDKSIYSFVGGKMALSIQLYEVDEGQQGYNYAELVTAVSASMYTLSGKVYVIEKLTIKAEMIPHSQGGTINVISAGQANNKGTHINPEDQQNDREAGAKIAGYSLGLVRAGIYPALGPWQRLGIGKLSSGITSLLYDYYGESLNGFDTYANGGDNYETSVSWTYPSGWIMNDDVQEAVATNYINWHYLRGHGDYRLKITATINWGMWLYFFWMWWYMGAQTKTLTLYIDV